MTRIDDAELEHREAVARAVALSTATLPGIDEDGNSSTAGEGEPATTRGHELIVVRERWRWLTNLVAFNIFWIAMSAYAATTAGTSMIWLVLLFPEIPAFRAAPVLPISVIAIAVFVSLSYAAMGVKGTKFGWRFFASMTMCGTVSAVASAAISGGFLLLIPLMYHSS